MRIRISVTSVPMNMFELLKNMIWSIVFFSFFSSPVTHTDGKFRAELSKLTMIGRTKHDEL